MCNIYTENGEWSQCHPDSKVHGANMGPTWVLSAPDGPHVGPMNLAIMATLSSLVIMTICDAPSNNVGTMKVQSLNCVCVCITKHTYEFYILLFLVWKLFLKYFLFELST